MLAVRDLRGIACEALGQVRELGEQLRGQRGTVAAVAAQGGGESAGAGDYEALMVGEAACLGHGLLPFLRR